MCAENYQNRDRFDKDITKIKQGSFFCLTWYIHTDRQTDMSKIIKHHAPSREQLTVFAKDSDEIMTSYYDFDGFDFEWLRSRSER